MTIRRTTFIVAALAAILAIAGCQAVMDRAVEKTADVAREYADRKMQDAEARMKKTLAQELDRLQLEGIKNPAEAENLRENIRTAFTGALRQWGEEFQRNLQAGQDPGDAASGAARTTAQDWSQTVMILIGIPLLGFLRSRIQHGNGPKMTDARLAALEAAMQPRTGIGGTPAPGPRPQT